MATANFSIKPSDGWVQITDLADGVAFIRVRGYPKTQPFFITASSSTPSASARGFLVDCHDFWVNVLTDEDYYVRVTNPRGDSDLRIDVFTIEGPSA